MAVQVNIGEFLISPYLLARRWRNVPENDDDWFKYLVPGFIAFVLYVVLVMLVLFLVTT